MTCAICEIRKEKRFCPAVHGRICPQCCGQEREITLDCPSECPYLQQARRNELPRALADIPQELLMPDVRVRQEFLYEREPLLVGLGFAVTDVARHDRALTDRDPIAAITSMAKSYETMVRTGLIYQQPTASPGQQAIITQIQKMLDEYRQVEAQHLGRTTLRDADILEGLVFLLRMAHAHTTGRPRSRAFLDFLATQYPEKKTAISEPGEGGSKIILP